MNTNQLDRTKGSNLSVTAKGQKNTCSTNNSNSNSGENKPPECKNSSYGESHECSARVCSTTWKPIPHIA